MMATPDVYSAVSGVATAIGVAVAAYQLLVARKQAATTFEDSLTVQYREIVAELPLEALFGESLPADQLHSLSPHFYRYFDLCNEQAFLYRSRRITRKTWSNWEEGILTNMRRPAFAQAWAEVARRATDDFDELRRLCSPGTLHGDGGGNR
jgi:hypothetical protein